MIWHSMRRAVPVMLPALLALVLIAAPLATLAACPLGHGSMRGLQQEAAPIAAQPEDPGTEAGGTTTGVVDESGVAPVGAEMPGGEADGMATEDPAALMPDAAAAAPVAEEDVPTSMTTSVDSMAPAPAVVVAPGDGKLPALPVLRLRCPAAARVLACFVGCIASRRPSHKKVHQRRPL